MLQPQSSSNLLTNRSSTLLSEKLHICSWLTKSVSVLASVLACINISTEESQTRESEFLWVSTRPLKCPSKRYIRNM